MPFIFKPGRYLLNKKLKTLKKYSGGKILDVGSGGKDYRWIFDKYDEYKTLEIDDKFKPDIIASAYEIPLPSDFCDTIICTQVLEHLDNPQKALKEFYRVLKGSGHCIISTPFFNELHDEPIDYFRYTKFLLKRMSEDCGFAIILLEPTSGYFSLRAQVDIKYFWQRWEGSRIKMQFLSLVSKIYGRIMIYLDNHDKSLAKNKYTIDWVMVLKK